MYETTVFLFQFFVQSTIIFILLALFGCYVPGIYISYITGKSPLPTVSLSNCVTAIFSNK